MKTPEKFNYLIDGLVIEASSEQEAQELYPQILEAELEQWFKEAEEAEWRIAYSNHVAQCQIDQWERDQEERLKEEQIADESMTQWYSNNN